MFIKLTSTTWISGSLDKGQQGVNPEKNRKCNEKHQILFGVVLFPVTGREKGILLPLYSHLRQTQTFISLLSNNYL